MSRVRQARRRAGLSQEELAKASGVSQATVVQAELGYRRPQGRTLRKLAAVLDVTVADLVEEEESPKAPAPPQPEVAEPSGHAGEKPPPITVAMPALEARAVAPAITVEVETLFNVLRLVEASKLTAEDGMRLLKGYAA